MYYSRNHITVTLVFFLFVLVGFGQEDSLVREANEAEQVQAVNSSPVSEAELNAPFDANQVESISYRLYLNKQWEQLCVYGETANRQQIDYYYLRVRMGVAYFELAQYRKAAAHFDKSLEFKTADDFANSYLYYCYLYSERFEEAKVLTKSFSPQLKQSYHVDAISPVDFVSIESGLKAADSSRQFKNALFSTVSLNHSLSNRVFLFHSLTYYTQDEERFRVKQFQYYLKAGIPLKKGFQLYGAMHVIGVSADVRSFIRTVESHTALVQPNGPEGQPKPPLQVLTFTTLSYPEKITRVNHTSVIAAFTLCKRTVFADYSLGTTLANFDTTRQYQLNAGVTIYPFKNNRLGLGTAAYLHLEKPFNTINLTIAPLINFYPVKKVNIAVAYLNNNGPNISENTGAFVSNSVDYTTRRISLSCSVNIAQSIWLYGTYAYEQKKQRTAGYTYDYNIFVIGVKAIPQRK